MRNVQGIAALCAMLTLSAWGAGGGSLPPLPPGSLQLSQSKVSVNEAAGTVSVQVTRTGGTAGAVSAMFTTTAGSATAVWDFTATSTTVFFANGDAAAKTVDIPIRNGSGYEPPENFTVTLSAATGGATLGAPTSAIVTIVDKDLGLLSSSPATGAVGVGRDATVQLTFSAPIDPASIAGHVNMTTSGGVEVPVPGAVTVNGAVVSFAPTSRLATVTGYTLVIDAAVSGTGGEQLANSLTVTFTTVDRSWQSVSLVEMDSDGNASLPRVAFDAAGNALAVWQQFNGVRDTIRANRYDVGAGWGLPLQIENGIGAASYPRIAVDPAGNAIAIWSQYYGVDRSILASRYLAGSGWDVAQVVESQSNDALFPQIAMDAAGNATAVWQQSVGVNPAAKIWSNLFIVGTGWGSPLLVESSNAAASESQVVMSPSAITHAVWAVDNGTSDRHISTNRYEPGSGWSGTSATASGTATTAHTPRIAVDGAGNVIVVWVEGNQIVANGMPAAGSFGVPQVIGNAILVVAGPELTVDSSGNALAVWRQDDGTGFEIWGARYDVPSGWHAPERLDTADGQARDAEIAFDPAGNALLVWSQRDGTVANRFHIWARRFIAASGWQYAMRVDSEDTGDAARPVIAFDAQGNALALWKQFDGVRFNIWANRFE